MAISLVVASTAFIDNAAASPQAGSTGAAGAGQNCFAAAPFGLGLCLLKNLLDRQGGPLIDPGFVYFNDKTGATCRAYAGSCGELGLRGGTSIARLEGGDIVYYCAIATPGSPQGAGC